MKKTRNIGLLVLLATSLGQLNATQTIGGLPFETTATIFHPTDIPASAHGLQFGQLPQVWDEGIPLGNGIMGALIWQKGDRLRLALDRADLWDLRPVKEFSGSDYTFRFICEAVEKKDMSPVYRLIDDRTSIDIAPSKIPAGAIEIPIAGLGKVKSTELDVHTAVCTIIWKMALLPKSSPTPQTKLDISDSPIFHKSLRFCWKLLLTKFLKEQKSNVIHWHAWAIKKER